MYCRYRDMQMQDCLEKLNYNTVFDPAIADDCNALARE